MVYPSDSTFRSQATEYGFYIMTKNNVILILPLYIYSWGINHENHGITQLKKCMKEFNLHQHAEVNGAGLHVSFTHGYLAATPDGIFVCSCHGKAVIEIIFSFSHKNYTLGEAATNDKNVCLSLDKDGILQLKRSHAYFYQVL